MKFPNRRGLWAAFWFLPDVYKIYTYPDFQASDVLLLGWHNRRPPLRLLDRALALKEQGKSRFLGLSGHNRNLFPELAQKGIFDVFHMPYNAAHRGAETEAFPALQELPPEVRPGLVTYTTTREGNC
jgi:hypothetical protein